MQNLSVLRKRKKPLPRYIVASDEMWQAHVALPMTAGALEFLIPAFKFHGRRIACTVDFLCSIDVYELCCTLAMSFGALMRLDADARQPLAYLMHIIHANLIELMQSQTFQFKLLS